MARDPSTEPAVTGIALLALSLALSLAAARPPESRPCAAPMKDTDKRRIFAALHIGPIRSPLDAVRAALVAENRPAGK